MVPSGTRPALALTAVLAALGGRYGFHRDELYFVEAGRHPAFGYPDQPPLVPLLAAGWHAVVGGSLVGFRLLPAVAAGLVVLVAAATARTLGATAREAGATAVVVALCSAVTAIGHLFSTTVFDLLATSTLLLVLVRAVHPDGGDPQDAPGGAAGPRADLGRWLLVGLVAGVALQVKTLPALVLLACAAGLLVAGPRAVLRRPGPWLAALVAALLAAPNLLWQNANGWPQADLSAAIAAGSSGTSVERWLVVPLQAELTGPVLAVPLVAGVVALLRAPALRPYRWLGVGYLVLLALVVAAGGKPYYTVGMLPVLVAAGTPAVLRWADAAPGRWRTVTTALAVHVVVSAVLTLPVLPVRALGAAHVTAVNYDAGETVGWPRLVTTVADAVAALPAADRARAVVLTENYGEAGALSRARRAGAALPPVHSGHNGYWRWGPPDEGAAPVVAVGFTDDAALTRLLTGCRTVARVDNGVGLDNDEQGAPVRVCSGPVRPWALVWPDAERLG
ncbi:glycosyltransferase family 39 protein [Kineosporia sp. R_H_3]|uniref:ArnT family glycosyltransferase n=1 Tax=Kineosporia sp. R_H_3 TaxID=1961848 RepID=UPI000B4AF7AB|nr:glycosyltransferase family 39 protein [Kineosporia sp. R_H_3]